MKKKNVFKNLFCAMFVVFSMNVFAQNQLPTFYLSEPYEGNTELCFHIAREGNGKKISFWKCDGTKFIASYTTDAFSTQAAGVPVFGKKGGFLFPYDDDSFVIAIPNTNANIGLSSWNSYKYIGLWSSEQSKAENVSIDEIKRWTSAIAEKVKKKRMGY